ncbi:MAG: hypothetical protein ACXVPN_07465 [Bacteroidia bacterium]
MKYLLIFLFSISALFAQKKVHHDFSVVIHESTLNKVLKTIDSINGTNDYEVLFVSGKYYWTAKNMQVKIRPDSSQFICDVKVNVGPFTHKTKVVGDLKIFYNKVSNQIDVKVARAIFELYTVVLGKKIHIKDVDLADYFKEPFSFEGPQHITTEMEVALPDGKSKTVYMQPSACEIELKWKEIVADFELESCDVPFCTLKN